MRYGSQVLVDGLDVVVRHVAEYRPRHDLKQRAKLRMLILEIGAVAQHLSELGEGQLQVSRLLIGRDVTRGKRAERHPPGEVGRSVKLLGLPPEGIVPGSVRRTGVTVGAAALGVDDIGA